MVIVSDTSIITNLIQIGELSLLRKIFGKVQIPTKVYDELQKLPDQITLIDKIDWIAVVSIENQSLFNELIQYLDPGEAESIVLALETKADLLLIDERKGRRIAKEYGILITGLLGVLLEAKSLGLVTALKPLLEKLKQEAGFRIGSELLREVLKKAGEI